MEFLLIYLVGICLMTVILVIDITRIKKIKIKSAEQYKSLALMSLLWPITLPSLLLIWTEPNQSPEE